jgi:hypothetical protein
MTTVMPPGIVAEEEAEGLAAHRAHVQRLIDVALDESENLPMVAINQLIDAACELAVRRLHFTSYDQLWALLWMLLRVTSKSSYLGRPDLPH